jgi:hypothetical protein
MTDLNPADVKPRLKALGLFGLIDREAIEEPV